MSIFSDQLLASTSDKPDDYNDKEEQDVSTPDNCSENGSNASFRTVSLSSTTPSESDSLPGLSHPNLQKRSFPYYPSYPVSPLHDQQEISTPQHHQGDEDEEEDDMYSANLTDALNIRSTSESPMTEIDLETPRESDLPPSHPYSPSDTKITSEEVLWLTPYLIALLLSPWWVSSPHIKRYSDLCIAYMLYSILLYIIVE